jgi:hypothetical protein
MRKISVESKATSSDVALSPVTNLGRHHSSNNEIDETMTVGIVQSSDLIMQPTKKRKTTQFATHVPKICELWTSLSPQEKLKWEQLAMVENSLSQNIEVDTNPESDIAGT